MTLFVDLRQRPPRQRLTDIHATRANIKKQAITDTTDHDNNEDSVPSLIIVLLCISSHSAWGELNNPESSSLPL